MNYDDEDWAVQVARKVRRESGGVQPLSQLDGGEWGTVELDDKSGLREKLGFNGALPPEPPAGRVVDGDIVV